MAGSEGESGSGVGLEEGLIQLRISVIHEDLNYKKGKKKRQTLMGDYP